VHPLRFTRTGEPPARWRERPGGLRGVRHDGAVATYEYRAVTVAPDADRDKTKELLAIHAEYGDWELAQHAIYPGGRRRVTVRRRLRADPLPPLPS
jgi:hypothetical protein